MIALPRKGSIVSDAVKYEIAKELGFGDKIDVRDGIFDYGNITTREAGLLVRGLIQKAAELMARQMKA
ncbi:MAG: small, acid-soluble spore protein, alpha/beta type [Bacillota bacterium]